MAMDGVGTGGHGGVDGGGRHIGLDFLKTEQEKTKNGV